MKKLLLFLFVLILPALSAQAQIGWTLEKCRKQFGQEQKVISDTETGKWYVFSTGSEKVSLALDDDGTVGHIEWQKVDHQPYQLSEMEQHLKEASAVTWKRIHHGRRTPNFTNQCAATINWDGIKNGEVIFMASYQADVHQNILAIGNYAD